MTDVIAEVIVERVMLDTEAYVLFAARHQDGQYVRVRYSNRIEPVEGEMYRVFGREWYRQDTRGRSWRQIDASKIERVHISGALIGRWLERLPYIGEKRAERLRNAFRGNLAEVLTNIHYLKDVAAVIDPEKPLLANKIATKIFATIAARSARHASVAEEIHLFEKLESLGVTDDRAARAIWRLVGGSAATERLLANPYLGASLMAWAKADHLGRALLKERAPGRRIRGHPERLLGSVDSAWRDILATGDTAVTAASLQQMLTKKGVDPDEAIALAVERRHVVVAQTLYCAPGGAWLENDLVSRLHALEDAESLIHAGDWSSAAEEVARAEESTFLTLNDAQRAAVQTLIMLPVGVLQGAAGVGKTTVMKVMAEVWEQMGGTVVMGALSGKAALQLAISTSTAAHKRSAYTVARLLRMANESGRDWSAPGSSVKENGIKVDSKTLLILDEASMLDTPSLRQVVALLPLGARLLLVGDCGQLPPVGIGCVFHDLVDDGSRVVTLTKVLRQAQGSPVPAAAALVRTGSMPPLEPWAGQPHGFFWLEEPMQKIANSKQIYEVYASLLERTADVMVVAALRSTVNKINERAAGLRRAKASLNQVAVRLNPLCSVTSGDPVVCTKNRYNEGMFNGLLGRVTEATPEAVRILWDGETEPREVTKEIGLDIELAYAITCHRAQGSAARCVIVCVEDSGVVTRNWLYTAITRTRETVILVSSFDAVSKAVGRRSDRVTGFAGTLKTMDDKRLFR